MSAFWLLVLPVAGVVWYVVGEVARAIPHSNDDFMFW